MGMGHIEVELLIHEHAHKPITGEVLAVGRQHISPSPDEILAMMARHGVTPVRTDFEPDTLNTHHGEGEHPILDASLFRAMGNDTYFVADISPYEGADYIFDVCGEVPEELIGRFDFIIDGGSLDNVFDPLSMVRNMTKMLRPGGRMFIFAWSNGFPSAYVKITPDWIMDYCLVNEFADAKVYASRCDMPFDDPKLGQSVDLFHYHPYIDTPNGPVAEAAYVRVPGYGSTYCIAEKGVATTHHRMAVQKHYRGQDVEPYLTSAKRFHDSTQPAFSLPGAEVPDMPPISDQITVRPVARFGTPSTISLPDAIFRRLDQIGTDTRLARLEARLQAAEAGQRVGELSNRMYYEIQGVATQQYALEMQVATVSDRTYSEFQKLSRQLYEYAVQPATQPSIPGVPRHFLSRARRALLRLAGR